MCLLPGAIRALPLITVSLSSASLTDMAHMESSLLAKAAVNRSGICWTMTMPGASIGMAVRNSAMASVPPVDAPTTITFSVVFNIAFAPDFCMTASADSLLVIGRGGRKWGGFAWGGGFSGGGRETGAP